MTWNARRLNGTAERLPPRGVDVVPAGNEHDQSRREGVRTVRSGAEQDTPIVSDHTLPTRLTVPEVARHILRTTPRAVYAMNERGQLPGAIRIGRRLLFDRDDLLDWLRQKRAPSPKE